MSRRGVKGNAHDSLEIAQQTAERLASKHGVRLGDGAQVIYPTARKLNPFIPRYLGARQCAAASGLFWSEEARKGCEVPVTYVHFLVELRVGVRRIFVYVRVISDRTHKAARIGDLPEEGYSDGGEVAGVVVMTIHRVLRRCLVARFLDMIARCVPDGRCVVRKARAVIHGVKPITPTNVADVPVSFSGERHNSSEGGFIRDTCHALSEQNVNAPDLNRV